MMAAPGASNGASALQTEFKSPEFDLDRAKQDVVSLQSTSQSPSYEQSKPLSQALPSESEPVSIVPKAEGERQSQSRSMSRTTSSASMSSGIVVANQEQSASFSPNAEATAAPSINGASGTPLSSNVVVDLNVPNSLIPDPHVQGDTAPNSATANIPEKPDGVLDVLTPRDSPVPPSSAQKPSQSRKASTAGAPAPKARLPHDKIGIFEDRVKEDPRGDIEAWFGLIEEHRNRSRLQDARKVYERFLNILPNSAEVWISYAQMENETNDREKMDAVLGSSLMKVPSLPLWSMYLDHVRRYNNLTTDPDGTARKIIIQAYELALAQVGLDKDSGQMWQDFIQFIKSGPGIIGGSTWQDRQKMDQLRKLYQEAICVPTQATTLLWKEYDSFEMGLNKMTGRQNLQKHSPAYMSARGCYTELQNITRDLRRTTLPSLPPALGFEGDVEYTHQLGIWKRWIQWEIDDPLVLKADETSTYQARVLFAYQQALMAMRYWPELWSEASDFCFSNGLDDKGDDFLAQGINANPESCLLAFKRADRIELTMKFEDDDEDHTRRAAAVRQPYDKVLDALYELITRSDSRKKQELARIEAQFIAEQQTKDLVKDEPEEDQAVLQEEASQKEAQKAEQIEATKRIHDFQVRLLSRTLSYVWIALTRATRRIQGKGRQEDGGPRGVFVHGSRAVFADARKRGRLSADFYVQTALLEFHCYDAETGRKIFERGLKLHPKDEGYALEYIKHLVANNDHINARVVFETVVTRLAQEPEKTKPLYAYFHDFESRYGELAQITKLEKRMSDLFPEDPALVLFSKRFTSDGFDPTAIRPIISPAKQTLPRIIPSIQGVPSAAPTPQIKAAASPKRPLPFDEPDEAAPPMKIIRTESPYKSASAQPMVKQNSKQQMTPAPPLRQPMQQTSYALPPLPRDINFLLSIIPRAETYAQTKFDSKELVRLIRETYVPNHISQLPQNGPARAMQVPAPPPPTQHIPPPHLQGPPPPGYPHPGVVPPMQQRAGLPPMPQVQHMQAMGYPPYGQQPPGLTSFSPSRSMSANPQSVPYAYGR